MLMVCQTKSKELAFIPKTLTLIDSKDGEGLGWMKVFPKINVFCCLLFYYYFDVILRTTNEC